MTVILKIEAVEFLTKNGTLAIVDGIDMTSGDPFSGKIKVESGQVLNARWRSNGMIRDAHPHWNIPTDTYEYEELYAVAKAVGAKIS